MYIKKILFADGFNLDWIITAANISFNASDQSRPLGVLH